MVCGIVSVVLGWIPVLFAVGAVLAVLAIIFGIVGLRRARTSGRRRGLAITGLVTGAFGMPIAILGLVFTIVVFQAIDRYENPPESTVVDRLVRRRGGTRPRRRRVAQRWRPREPVHRLRRVPRAAVRTDDRAPGGGCLDAARRTARFAVEHRFEADDVECEITAVNGPLPFGLEVD